MLVKRELSRLRLEFPALKVKEIDVVLNPLHAWHSGIRMIPALKAGDDLLAGVFLGAEEIRQFVVRYLNHSAQALQETL